jgi:hypothetical protein
LLCALTSQPHTLKAVGLSGIDDPLDDDDLHLGLYLCYELHYRGLPGVDDGWEWETSLLALRQALEQCFEQALIEAVPVREESVAPDDMDLALREIAEDDGPSVSSYIRSEASVEHVREFMVHRSAYQL